MRTSCLLRMAGIALACIQIYCQLHNKAHQFHDTRMHTWPMESQPVRGGALHVLAWLVSGCVSCNTCEIGCTWTSVGSSKFCSDKACSSCSVRPRDAKAAERMAACSDGASCSAMAAAAGTCNALLQLMCVLLHVLRSPETCCRRRHEPYEWVCSQYLSLGRINRTGVDDESRSCIMF